MRLLALESLDLELEENTNSTIVETSRVNSSGL